MSFWCDDSHVSLLFMTLLLYSHFHSLRITPSVFSQVIPMTLWFCFVFFLKPKSVCSREQESGTLNLGKIKIRFMEQEDIGTTYLPSP